MSEVKRVITLLRVSTSAQDMTRQATDVQRVVASHNLQVIRQTELPGVSGRAVLQNAEVQKMLRDLKRPDVAGVAISALDRLFRPNMYADFAILDAFRETGKLIYSAKEGTIDSASDMGFLVSLMSGAQAGMEWRELRRRTQGGKAEKRKQGRCVDGTATVPKGLGYKRLTDAAGRTTGHIWSYVEPHCSLISRAYDLLFAGHTYQGIAKTLGRGWTGRGVQYTLKNPVWMGVRRYPPDAQGNVLEHSLGITPLISPERWHAAQQIMQQRRGEWSKVVREARFLATGLLVCSCGKKYYIHGDGRRGYHDVYYCSSRFKGGPGCGGERLWREHVDAAVERIACEYLTSATFIKGVLAKLRQTQHPADADRRDKELAKLTARRERIIDAWEDGRLTKDEFSRRLDANSEAMRELEARVPVAPPPALDERKVITALARQFAPSRFRNLPFEEKRTALKSVVRRLPVTDGTISQVTVSGAFLQEFAHTNSPPRSSPSLRVGVCPDVTITLPQPIRLGQRK